MSEDSCIYCYETVSGRQEALQCEDCCRWQHRKCKTGIGRWRYKRAVFGVEKIKWRCRDCLKNHKSKQVRNDSKEDGKVKLKPPLVMSSESPGDECDPDGSKRRKKQTSTVTWKPGCFKRQKHRISSAMSYDSSDEEWKPTSSKRPKPAISPSSGRESSGEEWKPYGSKTTRIVHSSFPTCDSSDEEWKPVDSKKHKNTTNLKKNKKLKPVAPSGSSDEDWQPGSKRRKSIAIPALSSDSSDDEWQTGGSKRPKNTAHLQSKTTMKSADGESIPPPKRDILDTNIVLKTKPNMSSCQSFDDDCGPSKSKRRKRKNVAKSTRDKTISAKHRNDGNDVSTRKRDNLDLTPMCQYPPNYSVMYRDICVNCIQPRVLVRPLHPRVLRSWTRKQAFRINKNVSKATQVKQNKAYRKLIGRLQQTHLKVVGLKLTSKQITQYVCSKKKLCWSTASSSELNASTSTPFNETSVDSDGGDSWTTCSSSTKTAQSAESGNELLDLCGAAQSAESGNELLDLCDAVLAGNVSDSTDTAHSDNDTLSQDDTLSEPNVGFVEKIVLKRLGDSFVRDKQRGKHRSSVASPDRSAVRQSSNIGNDTVGCRDSVNVGCRADTSNTKGANASKARLCNTAGRSDDSEDCAPSGSTNDLINADIPTGNQDSFIIDHSQTSTEKEISTPVVRMDQYAGQTNNFREDMLAILRRELHLERLLRVAVEWQLSQAQQRDIRTNKISVYDSIRLKEVLRKRHLEERESMNRFYSQRTQRVEVNASTDSEPQQRDGEITLERTSIASPCTVLPTGVDQAAHSVSTENSTTTHSTSLQQRAENVLIDSQNQPRVELSSSKRTSPTISPSLPNVDHVTDDVTTPHHIRESTLVAEPKKDDQAVRGQSDPGQLEAEAMRVEASNYMEQCMLKRKEIEEARSKMTTDEDERMRREAANYVTQLSFKKRQELEKARSTSPKDEDERMRQEAANYVTQLSIKKPQPQSDLTLTNIQRDLEREKRMRQAVEWQLSQIRQGNIRRNQTSLSRLDSSARQTDRSTNVVAAAPHSSSPHYPQRHENASETRILGVVNPIRQPDISQTSTTTSATVLGETPDRTGTEHSKNSGSRQFVSTDPVMDKQSHMQSSSQGVYEKSSEKTVQSRNALEMYTTTAASRVQDKALSNIHVVNPVQTHAAPNPVIQGSMCLPLSHNSVQSPQPIILQPMQVLSQSNIAPGQILQTSGLVQGVQAVHQAVNPGLQIRLQILPWMVPAQPLVPQLAQTSSQSPSTTAAIAEPVCQSVTSGLAPSNNRMARNATFPSNPPCQTIPISRHPPVIPSTITPQTNQLLKNILTRHGSNITRKPI